MKRPSVRRALTWLRREALVILAWPFLLCAGLLLAYLAVPVLNADFAARATETKPLYAERDAFFNVTVIVHQVNASENTVDLSVLVEAPYDQIPASYRDKQNCFTLSVLDRSTRGRRSRDFEVSCKPREGVGLGRTDLLVFETERFAIEDFPSVPGYPFDDVTILPLVYLLTGESTYIPANLFVRRTLPGKVLEIHGSDLNYEIRIARPALEKSLVLLSSIAFLTLSVVVAVKLFFGRTDLTGMQELLAVAGYIVSAAGFRDLVGVTHTNGGSALELAIFGVPMAALSLGIAVSTVRGRLRRLPGRGLHPSEAQPAERKESPSPARDRLPGEGLRARRFRPLAPRGSARIRR